MRDRVCGTIGAVGVLVLAGCKSIPSRAAPVAAESAVSANQAAPHDHLRFGRAAYEEFATDAQSTALNPTALYSGGAGSSKASDDSSVPAPKSSRPRRC